MATTGLAVYNPRENILDTVIRYAYIETKAFLVRFKEIIIIEVKDAVNDVKSTVKATIYTVKVAITGSNLNFPLLITDGEIPMTQEHEVNSGFGISLPTWFSSLWSASLPSTVPTAKTFTMWQILDLILVLLGLFFLLALLYKGYVKWKKPKAPVSLGVQKDVGHGDMEKNGEVENGKTKTSLPKVLPMLGVTNFILDALFKLTTNPE